MVEQFYVCSDAKICYRKEVKKAVDYIRAHFQENIALETVAAHVGLNASYFSSSFKKNVGLSFRDYVNSVRIEEAKTLMRNTDYSLANIAVAVGFDNQSYFTRVFKKQTGVSPSQYII